MQLKFRETLDNMRLLIADLLDTREDYRQLQRRYNDLVELPHHAFTQSCLCLPPVSFACTSCCGIHTGQPAWQEVSQLTPD